MTLSRSDRSLLTDWWFTVDRVQLTAIFALVGVGIVVSLAASPSVALAKDLPAFYFVHRHIAFSAIGIILILMLSLLSPRGVRRVSLVLFAVSLAALFVVHFWGIETNGAQRWLRIAGISLQPSELAKPAFVVLCAWAFAESQQRADMPALSLATFLYVIFAILLILQPDIGQTALISIIWGALFLLAGLSLIWVGAMLAAGLSGLTTAYFTMPHVKARIDLFLSPVIDERSQIGQAYQSFVQGGFFGRGPGEGTIKTSLPDAHTDLIFAVIAEEYGVVACLALVILFGLIVFRALIAALREHDLANRYGIVGLALLIAFQALINMGVNIGLLPAKGMTLPMISAGGSSIIGISITFGLLCALLRRRPQPARTRMRAMAQSGYGTSEFGKLQ